MIDPTRRPPPLRPVPSRVAAPFAAVHDYGSRRPWGDQIRDLNDPRFQKQAQALALGDSIWMPDGRLNAIKAMQNLIVSDLVTEGSMRNAMARGVREFSPAQHMDPELLRDPSVWRNAFVEATYAALWHSMDDEDQTAVSVDHATWDRRSTGSHPLIETERSSLISLDLPALVRKPTFADGTPVELFWVRPQPGRRLQILAVGPFGDADDEIAMTSFDVDARMGSDEEDIRRSALMRGGGERLVPEGWVESAVGLIPWIHGLAQCHLQLDLRRCAFDLTLRGIEIPELPLIVEYLDFTELRQILPGIVLPVAVDAPLP
jgi:hypothetical protein